MTLLCCTTSAVTWHVVGVELCPLLGQSFSQHCNNGFHVLIFLVFVFYAIAVISPPPVARSVSYSASPSSLEQPNSGNMSPACKVSSALDPNLGNQEEDLLLGFCQCYQQLQYMVTIAFNSAIAILRCFC